MYAFAASAVPITSPADPPEEAPPCKSIKIVVVIVPPSLSTNVLIAASGKPDPCAAGVIVPNLVAAVPREALFAPVDVPAATMLFPVAATF